MKRYLGLFARLLPLLILCSSCGALQKASVHGLNSGYYKMKDQNRKDQRVYLDVEEERMQVYALADVHPAGKPLMSVPLLASDTLVHTLIFTKQSLDIDVTSILLKYRPAVSGLPAQLTTDFNVALYAGWRHDRYKIKNRKDPLGKNMQQLVKRGYDFGIVSGPGTTLISPFTTNNRKADEYSAMIMQTGLAGFIESDVASFGLAVGTDVLLNEDRNIWIYTDKLWIGFVIGIALN